MLPGDLVKKQAEWVWSWGLFWHEVIAAENDLHAEESQKVLQDDKQHCAGRFFLR